MKSPLSLCSFYSLKQRIFFGCSKLGLLKVPRVIRNRFFKAFSTDAVIFDSWLMSWAHLIELHIGIVFLPLTCNLAWIAWQLSAVVTCEPQIVLCWASTGGSYESWGSRECFRFWKNTVEKLRWCEIEQSLWQQGGTPLTMFSSECRNYLLLHWMAMVKMVTDLEHAPTHVESKISCRSDNKVLPLRRRFPITLGFDMAEIQHAPTVAVVAVGNLEAVPWSSSRA